MLWGMVMTMTTTKCTLEQIPHHSRCGVRWQVSLVNTKSRCAFWSATAHHNGTVEIRYGPLGGKARVSFCSYATALKRIGDKLSRDYTYEVGLPSLARAKSEVAAQPPKKVAAQPPKKPTRTLSEQMGLCTMRQITGIELMDMSASHRFEKVCTIGEDFTGVYRGADAVSVMKATRGHTSSRMWVFVRYGDDLLCGLLKD